MTKTRKRTPKTPPPPRSYQAFGGGVQSSALALLIDRSDPRLLVAMDGKSPIPQAAFFADTGCETGRVYAHIDRVAQKLTRLELVRTRERGVSGEMGLGEAWLTNATSTPIPFFTRGGDGKTGMLQRGCTRDWKIRPLARAMRKHMGRGPRGTIGPRGYRVDVWLGISVDEIDRMKSTSPVTWQRLVYPLIEMGWSRQDCLDYLAKMGFENAPSSECYFCPYHSNRSWARMKREDPEGFQMACDFDRRMRSARPGGLNDEPCLHRSGKLLEDIDFSTEEMDSGGLGNECEGHCGL